MRSTLFAGAAIVFAAALAQPARAGVEQIYEGSAMPVLSAPTTADVGTERTYQPGRTTYASTSQVAELDVASERIAAFNGVAATEAAPLLAAR